MELVVIDIVSETPVLTLGTVCLVTLPSFIPPDHVPPSLPDIPVGSSIDTTLRFWIVRWFSVDFQWHQRLGQGHHICQRTWNDKFWVGNMEKHVNVDSGPDDMSQATSRVEGMVVRGNSLMVRESH